MIKLTMLGSIEVDPEHEPRHREAMKRALLIGVEDRHPDQAFQPEPSLDAMQSLLLDLGDWTLARVDGPMADRPGILGALEQLEREVGPDDTCLVYFVGHGGIVELMDLPPPLGQRPLFYICAARADAKWWFNGILDVELSQRLARIDQVCGNVSVILDCCYSARMVRGPLRRLHESPAWVRDVAERTDLCADELSSVSGHPRIVRLTASSSLRMTFPDRRPDGHLGRLTRLFTEVVREAELRLDHLIWDAVAHHVRERAILQLGCEEQWVSLLGPRERLVFSREAVDLPRTVGFVPNEQASGGWIRAGALQGVRIGDQWGRLVLTLDVAQHPRVCERLRVVAVDLNRAVLEPEHAEDAEHTAQPGSSAMLLSASEPAPVIVEGDSAVRAVVAASAWLHPCIADDAIGVLRVGDQAVEVNAANDVHAAAQFPAGAAGLAAAIDRLEDWRRARILSDVASARASEQRATSIEVGLGCYQAFHGSQQRRLLNTSDAIPSLSVGGRIFVRIAHVGRRAEWFVSVVEIDVAGRPRLLDESEPDGRELLNGETLIIGEDPHRRTQGIELRWPDEVAMDAPRVATIIVLASRRPIQLGHLVRGPSSDRRFPSDVPRVRRRASQRGHLPHPRPRTGPELADDWGATVIRYRLEPPC